MMARLVFLFSIILAFLVLRGWPADASVWMRSLIALGAIATGVVAIVLTRPAKPSQRFKCEGKPRVGDRLAGAAGIVILLGLLYFTLVFAPPAARELSYHVVTVIQKTLGTNGQTDKDDADDWGNETASNDSEFEAGAMFDPNGAVVPKAANVNPSSEPAISIKLSGGDAAKRLRGTGRIYMHLFSHHVFDGERWTSEVGDKPLYLSGDSDGWVDLDRSGQEPDYRYTILHHKLSTGLDAMTTLQGASQVKLPELTQLNAGTWLLPRPDNAFGIIRPYQAGSSPRWFRNLAASGEPLKPGVMGPAYLAPSKDQSLNRKIRELADTFRHQPTLELQLSTLQQWLSKSYGYSLNLDYPDKNKSALESFLSNPGSGEGFCVHFASAAALILRELGVPSRVSYGWTGGEFYPDHHQFVFTAQDGHAWAEIYLDGQGWVVFETTPASGLPPSHASAPGTAPPELEKFDDDKTSARNQTGDASAWLWVLLLIGGVAALGYVVVKWREHAGEAAGFESTESSSPAGYLQLFYRVGAAMGHPKPVGHTLGQYLEQLEREKLTIPFAGELLTYHYEVTYRDSPRNPRFEKRLRKQIKAL